MSDLIYTNTDNNLKYYDLTSRCCQKFFSSDLDKVRLAFKNNVLDAIFFTPVEKNHSDNWLSSEYKYLE